VAVIVRAADTARVVMVNERHHAAADRLLPLALLAPLRARGYRYLAAEAFDARDTLLLAGRPGRGRAPYARLGVTGVYTDDPVFAAVVREAVRLGYALVPYEADSAGAAHAADGLDSAAAAALTGQARRDRAQARTLHARTLARDPGARVLVLAGFGHVQEAPTPGWTPMALLLPRVSGVDPVTVDQTALSERGSPGASTRARAAPAGGARRGAAGGARRRRGRAVAPAGFTSTSRWWARPRPPTTHGRPRG
jgi:hypothetical protein